MSAIKARMFLMLACDEAKKSPDNSTKNGAVCVCEGKRNHGHPVYCADCNRFSVFDTAPIAPYDVKKTESDLIADRNTKLGWIEHAERNALFAAVRAGFDVKGSTIYCPFAACTDCARAMVLLGVKEIVRLPQSKIPRPETWADSIAMADSIMLAGGMTVSEYDGPDLGKTYLVNKTEWRV